MSTYTADQDPADFTVAEVTDFLETADAEQAGAVKAKEDAGKGRTGIMSYVPSASKIKPDEDGYTRVPVQDAYQPGEPIERPEDEGDTQE